MTDDCEFHLADTGEKEKKKERIYEPIPESVPVREPSPTPDRELEPCP